MTARDFRPSSVLVAMGLAVLAPVGLALAWLPGPAALETLRAAERNDWEHSLCFHGPERHRHHP